MSVQAARWAHRTFASTGTYTAPCVINTQRYVDLRFSKHARKSNSRDYGIISTSTAFADFDAEPIKSNSLGAPSGKNVASIQHSSDEKRQMVDTSSQARVVDTRHESRDKLLQILGGLPIDVNSKLVDIEYTNRLGSAVENCEADIALRCLIAAAKKGDMDFIRNISNTTFTTILQLHEPHRTIGKIAATHRYISPQQQASLKTKPIDLASHHHYKILRTIFRLRRIAGAELTLEQYVLLLRSARDLGKSGFAYALFKNINQAGYAMTTECWNYLIEAVLLSGQHRPEARQSYRVTPRNLEGRAEPIRHRRFLNYRLGEAEGGLKTTISELFDQMCDAGATADQATYRTLLVAAGREGDMDSVAAILKSAWGILLDGSAQSQQIHVDANQSASGAVDLDSRTLHSIVHVFLINNNISLALRALETISQNFDIPNKSRIWEEVLEYTMVLAKPRSRRGKGSPINKVDQLPLSSVSQVWDAFKRVSDDIKPTMSMYKYMFKTFYYARIPGEMLKVITESLGKFVSDEKSLDSDEKRLLLSPPDIPKHLHALQSRWERAQLEHRTHASWIRRAVLLLLDTTGRTIDIKGDMVLRQLPQAIISLRFWMPHRVSYEVVGGLVEFNFKPSSSHERLQEYKATRAAIHEKIINSPPRLFAPQGTQHLPPAVVSPTASATA